MSAHTRADCGGFRCLHCGESYLPSYPCPLGAYIALARWFENTHRDCLQLQRKGAP